MRVLGLLFTISVSLEKWVESGLFFREKRIYEEHLKLGHFDKIIWFTYGVNDKKIYDILLEKELIDNRIQIVPMPTWIKCPYKDQIYSVLLPFIQKEYCQQINIIKTNQMGGAWTAYFIAKKYKCKFLLRTGYTYSSILRDKYMQSNGKRIKKFRQKLLYDYYRMIEKRLYRKCDYATVSSVHDKEYLEKEYRLLKGKITVLTNFVDCELFKPLFVNKKDRFVFVGRLSEEKNIFNIINGVNSAGFGIDVYGKGELKQKLINYVNQNNFDVQFKGVVENAELPKVLNKYKYFILCSRYEGMPKTLLEAMACGIVCIGSNVIGINEVICDKQNGFLTSGIDANSIKECISQVVQYKHKELISSNAREYIVHNHSLEVIVERENELLSQK